MNEFLKVGRPVYTPDWGYGVVVAEEDALDMWLVSTVGGPLKAYAADKLVPLFTMDQVIDVKIQEQTTPSLMNDVAPFGMSSDELAQEVAQTLAESVMRIRGVGNDQYNDGTHQKFEAMDLDELFVYAREELLDLANYAVMLDIRIRRIQQALGERDDLGEGTEDEFEQTDYSVEDFEEGT